MARVRFRIRIGVADPDRESVKPVQPRSESGLAPRRRVHRMPSGTRKILPHHVSFSDLHHRHSVDRSQQPRPLERASTQAIGWTGRLEASRPFKPG